MPIPPVSHVGIGPHAAFRSCAAANRSPKAKRRWDAGALGDAAPARGFQIERHSDRRPKAFVPRVQNEAARMSPDSAKPITLTCRIAVQTVLRERRHCRKWPERSSTKIVAPTNRAKSSLLRA